MHISFFYPDPFHCSLDSFQPLAVISKEVVTTLFNCWNGVSLTWKIVLILMYRKFVKQTHLPVTTKLLYTGKKKIYHCDGYKKVHILFFSFLFSLFLLQLISLHAYTFALWNSSKMYLNCLRCDLLFTKIVDQMRWI